MHMYYVITVYFTLEQVKYRNVTGTACLKSALFLCEAA